MFFLHKCIHITCLLFVDKDECSENECGSVSNTICVDTIGSYFCKCKDGFSRPTSSGSCEGSINCIANNEIQKARKLADKHQIFRVHTGYFNIWKRYQYLFSKKDLTQSHKLFSRI